MADSLPRIGPLGRMYSVNFTEESSSKKAYKGFFRPLRASGFEAYGLHVPSIVPDHGVEAWRDEAQAAGVETHYVSNGAHSLDAPLFHKGRARRHAATKVHTIRALHAAACGMSSFVLSPPNDAHATRDDLEEEIHQIQDALDERGSHIRLGIMSGASANHLLRRPDDLLSFARETSAMPVLHAGFLAGMDRVPKSVDSWRQTLQQMGPAPMVLYANTQKVEGGIGWRGYTSKDDLAATPPLEPLFTAARELKVRPTVLVDGAKPDNDAFEAHTTMCRVYDIDPKSRIDFGALPVKAQDVHGVGHARVELGDLAES